jgi:hypothetical protein
VSLSQMRVPPGRIEATPRTLVYGEVATEVLNAQGDFILKEKRIAKTFLEVPVSERYSVALCREARTVVQLIGHP